MIKLNKLLFALITQEGQILGNPEGLFVNESKKDLESEMKIWGFNTASGKKIVKVVISEVKNNE